MKRTYILLILFLLLCFIPIAIWGGCLYVTETDEEETDGNDLDPPGEAINFTALPGNQLVLLSWVHPNDPDFAGVKIMCKTDDYPIDHTDGT